MRRILVALIRLYQVAVSPWIGNHCRFLPTCSQYAIEAIGKHGMVRGCLYSLWRVARCQPFCEGGHDPVPEGPECPGACREVSTMKGPKPVSAPEGAREPHQ